MLLCVAALLGFVSVAFGAYAEHGLRGEVSEETFRFLMTAIRYNQVHAVAASAVGLGALLYQREHRSLLAASGWAFVAGVALFSGGIYLSALLDQPALTMLTPVGGVTLMIAWAGLALFGFLAASADRKPARGPEALRGR